MLEKSPYPTVIQLKYYLDGIQHCTTIVDKWIFDRIFPFAPPLTKEILDYCCNTYDEKRIELLQLSIRSTQNSILKVLFRSEKS